MDTINLTRSWANYIRSEISYQIELSEAMDECSSGNIRIRGYKFEDDGEELAHIEVFFMHKWREIQQLTDGEDTTKLGSPIHLTEPQIRMLEAVRIFAWDIMGDDESQVYIIKPQDLRKVKKLVTKFSKQIEKLKL